MDRHEDDMDEPNRMSFLGLIANRHKAVCEYQMVSWISDTSLIYATTIISSCSPFCLPPFLENIYPKQNSHATLKSPSSQNAVQGMFSPTNLNPISRSRLCPLRWCRFWRVLCLVLSPQTWNLANNYVSRFHSPCQVNLYSHSIPFFL